MCVSNRPSAWIVVLALGAGVACRESARSSDASLPEPSGAWPSEPSSHGAARPLRSGAGTREVNERAPVAHELDESASPRDPLDRLLPAEQVPQGLAFSRYRLAAFEGERLVVRRVGKFETVASFDVPDGRNVVAMVGGGFLTAGSDHMYRLSGLDSRPERLPRAPRLGPTTLIPSLLESEQFWLSYEGIDTLPLFDLTRTAVPSLLSVQGWTALPRFDHRGLLAFGDGSLIYTVEGGLARIDSEGNTERLPVPELSGQIWQLSRASRWDQVWAATAHHAYRLTARGVPTTVERIGLPPHTVALASHDRNLAVLSVESVEGFVAKLRVDVHANGAPGPRVLRVTDAVSARADGGAPPFLPDIELSPVGHWVAVRGFGLHVYDWRRGEQAFPAPPAAQNLAPQSP